MKNQFKYFLEDITEVDDKMKNKLTILNSPIDILNKKVFHLFNLRKSKTSIKLCLFIKINMKIS
jgi:hypothetical protein